MSDPMEIPLFPLEMVLLPFKRVPLHIFEERYKLMVDMCREEETEFGVVWGTDRNFHEIGCAALITDLINRSPDGRMDIMVQGTRRFRVLESFEIHPYITGIVEEIADEPESLDVALGVRVQDLYREALKLSLGWFKPKQDREIDLCELSYVVAASLSLPDSEQQAILEMRSTNGRLQAVAEILENAMVGMREVKKRTGGNGHLAG